MADRRDNCYSSFSWGWFEDGRLGLQLPAFDPPDELDAEERQAAAEQDELVLAAVVEQAPKHYRRTLARSIKAKRRLRENPPKPPRNEEEEEDALELAALESDLGSVSKATTEPEPPSGPERNIKLPRPIAGMGTQDAQRTTKTAAGWRHSLIATPKGELFASGEGSDGQLGLGYSNTPTQQVAPQKVLFEYESGGGKLNRRRPFVQEVAVGDATSFAVTGDMKVFSWGRGKYGALGHGTEENVAVPREVARLSKMRVIEVAPGRWHCLARTKGGSVFAWGRNNEGQLGLVVEEVGGHIATPRQVKFTEKEKVVQLSAGDLHSCALIHARRADNIVESVVYAWGSTENGRLGRINPSKRTVPQEVTNLTSIMRKTIYRITAIACGGAHTLALTDKANHVLAWGEGRYGQLGTGNVWDRSEPSFIEDFRSVLAIAAGHRHSAAVVGYNTESGPVGTVWCWGFNSFGEVGCGDLNCRIQPTRVTALNGANVLSVSCGARHTMCVTPGKIRTVRDHPKYRRYFEMLDNEGLLVYTSLKKDMEHNGLRSEYLDTPDLPLPGQPGLTDEPTEIELFETGLRYCLDTAIPCDENYLIRGSYETAYKVPSCKLNHVCMACARRCHVERYVECVFRRFTIDDVCECAASRYCLCQRTDMRSTFDNLADKYGKRPKRITELEKLPFENLEELLTLIRAPKGGLTEEDFNNAENYLITELGGELPFQWSLFDSWYQSYYETEIAAEAEDSVQDEEEEATQVASVDGQSAIHGS